MPYRRNYQDRGRVNNFVERCTMALLIVDAM